METGYVNQRKKPATFEHRSTIPSVSAIIFGASADCNGFVPDYRPHQGGSAKIRVSSTRIESGHNATRRYSLRECP
jgi:hypothetical protein